MNYVYLFPFLGELVSFTTVFKNRIKWFLYWMVEVIRQCSMKSLSFVSPSLYPSVRPSLNLLKIRLSFFSDIVHHDSWPRYLVTDGARFLKKKFWRPGFGPKWLKSSPKLGFLSPSQVWSISFPCIYIQL